MQTLCKTFISKILSYIIPGKVREHSDAFRTERLEIKICDMILTHDHQNPFVHIYFLLSITSHKASEKYFCARRIKQQGGRHKNYTSLGFLFIKSDEDARIP